MLQTVAREVLRPFRRRRVSAPATVNATTSYPLDFQPQDIAIIEAVRPYTMTSPERICAVIQAVEHIVRAKIPGDVLECGVWKGGSMMAAALTLMRIGERRSLYLFDTFAGMTPPTEVDRDFTGQAAAEHLANGDAENSVYWCLAGLDEVRRNLATTGYPDDQIHFIPGRVEDTIPADAPQRIALLRLDTDWYESTRHELVCLYSRLAPGGVLIIDDYGHWQGARRATDEFLATLDHPPLLCRIDFTGRMAVKPA